MVVHSIHRESEHLVKGEDFFVAPEQEKKEAQIYFLPYRPAEWHTLSYWLEIRHVWLP